MQPAPRTLALGLAALLLAGCTAGPGGTPPWMGAILLDANYSAQRGQLELHVKANHPALITEIDAGGGPLLTTAMDLAAIPAQDRPTRQIQLNADLGLYAANPGALVTALMVFGG